MEWVAEGEVPVAHGCIVRADGEEVKGFMLEFNYFNYRQI